MDLKSIPKSVLVSVVLLLGVGALFVFSRPHTLCDTQIDSVKDSQKGQLFPGSNEKKPPAYEKALANCKLGEGSPGACFEYFKILIRLTEDLEPLSPTCGETLAEVKPIRKALAEGISMMVELAWGEAPPEKGEKVTGWLEGPDLALYCKMKSDWLKYFGGESFEHLKDSIYDHLPARKYETDAQGVRTCTNCDNLPKAVELLGGKEEVFGRSLFALSCQHYR
jgi:hypothetical protein